MASDQGYISAMPDDEAPEPSAVSATLGGNAASAPKGPSSCDRNLCRNVAGNFVYLKPLRELDPQPLFIQAQRCREPGLDPAQCGIVPGSGQACVDVARCEQVPYVFELLTRPGDLRANTPHTAWDITFTYPDREQAARAAEAKKQQDARMAAWRERQALKPPPPSAPAVSANWRYGYRGSQAVQPDEAWDDGRTTFLRFNGNRRVPNVYRRLPDGQEAIPAYAAEPDAAGVTLRIARTEAKWFIRDGDEAGCLFNVGPDPDGRTANTVASAAPAPRAVALDAGLPHRPGARP